MRCRGLVLTVAFQFFKALRHYDMVSSALLAFAFVFGSTAAIMFRALIMIFSTNPFGVGDWVRMGDDTVKIKEIGLNFYVVVNFWGEVLFVPVTTMLDSKIFNLSRSPPLWMSYNVHLDLGGVHDSRAHS